MSTAAPLEIGSGPADDAAPVPARRELAPLGDGALVAAARAGRGQAVAAIYQRYGRVVHAAILARVPAQEAEDLVQDVFAAAVRRLPSLRDGEALGGWLLTIARNRVADYW